MGFFVPHAKQLNHTILIINRWAGDCHLLICAYLCVFLNMTNSHAEPPKKKITRTYWIKLCIMFHSGELIEKNIFMIVWTLVLLSHSLSLSCYVGFLHYFQRLNQMSYFFLFFLFFSRPNAWWFFFDIFEFKSDYLPTNFYGIFLKFIFISEKSSLVSLKIHKMQSQCKYFINLPFPHWCKNKNIDVCSTQRTKFLQTLKSQYFLFWE